MAGTTTNRRRPWSRAAPDPQAPRFRVPEDRPLTIGIAAKLGAPEAEETCRGLAGWLSARGAEVTLETGLRDLLGSEGPAVPREEIGEGRDLVVVLGGDGTLLSVARAMGRRQVPIFGVNLGSLGFLTTAPLDQLYSGLERIFAGEGILNERAMLSAVLLRGGTVAREELAVNDVVITGASIARVLEVRITTSQGFVATVLGDGVIVSTPTGSTAYSLGAGGPVVHPAVEAIVLAPIVPLTLAQRPVVFPDSEELLLTLRNRRREVRATFDGQASEPMLPSDSLRVGKSDVRLRLLRLPEQNYFRVLRKKLLWGALPPKRGRSTPPVPPDL